MANVPIAKIFTVTKDEYDLIEDFILYYGKIFGYNNLIIIDNMSTNQHVLNIYKKYPVNVVYESGYQKGKQGEHFTKYMNMYKTKAKYLIGVDTDEFLYVMNSNKTTSYENIIDYLNHLPSDYDIFRIKYYDWSVPNKYSSDYIDYKHIRPVRHIKLFKRNSNENLTRKNFYKANNFIDTASGNHHGHTTNNKPFITQLGYLHFSNTGKKRTIERAMNICIGYDYISKNDNKDVIINKLEENVLKRVGCNGFHRRDELYYFMRREYIINLFVKYIKRFPEKKELDIHINKNTTLKQKEIEFKGCNEAIKMKDIIFNVTNKNILDLVYDEGVDDLKVGMIIDGFVIVNNDLMDRFFK